MNLTKILQDIVFRKVPFLEFHLVHTEKKTYHGFCWQDTLPKTQKSSAGTVEDENAETMLLDVKKEEAPSQDEEELRQGNIHPSYLVLKLVPAMRM